MQPANVKMPTSHLTHGNYIVFITNSVFVSWENIGFFDTYRLWIFEMVWIFIFCSIDTAPAPAALSGSPFSLTSNLTNTNHFQGLDPKRKKTPVFVKNIWYLMLTRVILLFSATIQENHTPFLIVSCLNNKITQSNDFISIVELLSDATQQLPQQNPTCTDSLSLSIYIYITLAHIPA